MSSARGVAIGAAFVFLAIIIAGVVALDFYLQRASSEPEILRPQPTVASRATVRPILEPPPTPTQIVIPIVLPPTTVTAPPTPTQVETDENANEPEIYEVIAGDTLLGIARQFGVSVEEIMALNEIEDPSVIGIGQELLIPPE